MVVLKKIKASTLMETMVATVLIVVIFMIASMLLNSVFKSTNNRMQQPIIEKMNTLEYQYANELIKLPYYEEWKEWDIEMLVENSNIVLSSIHKKTKKEVKTVILSEE